MNNQLRALQVGHQLIGNGAELWFVLEEFVADTMNFQRIFMAIASGVQVEVEVLARELAVHHFDATDLNDAVSAVSRKACGLGV